MFLRHHFLRDFVSALCATVGIRHLPHLCLRVPGLGFQKHRFRVTIAMPCEHPLLHLLYILSGVGNEAVKAERFRALLSAKERSPIHDSENDPREADGGKDGHTVDKQLSALHNGTNPPRSQRQSEGAKIEVLIMPKLDFGLRKKAKVLVGKGDTL